MLKDDIAAMSRAKKVKCESFVYSAVFNPLPAAGQLVITIPISNDADFIILATTLVSYSAVGILVVGPDYTIQYLDTSSGRTLMDVPAHVANVTGTGPWPYVWPEPYMLKGGSNFSVTLINPTAVAARVDVAFIGYKMFYLEAYAR